VREGRRETTHKPSARGRGKERRKDDLDDPSCVHERQTISRREARASESDSERERKREREEYLEHHLLRSSTDSFVFGVFRFLMNSLSSPSPRWKKKKKKKTKKEENLHSRKGEHYIH
jgi:hypothetical protein